MAISWFICPYKRRTVIGNWPKYRRYCAMDDFTPQIHGEGGWWAETECLGNVALVKVRASNTLLNTINGTTGYIRITNHGVLSDTLSDLTTTQRNAINARLLNMGYTQAEINTVMGANLAAWRQKSFLTLLHLVATRRRKPRYDPDIDDLVFDGEIFIPRSVESVDAEVI